MKGALAFVDVRAIAPVRNQVTKKVIALVTQGMNMQAIPKMEAGAEGIFFKTKGEDHREPKDT